MTGTSTDRSGLVETLSPGNTLVVWKVDRLIRSLPSLVALTIELGGRGASFRSMSDPPNTTSAGRHLVMHIMRALAERERSPICERNPD